MLTTGALLYSLFFMLANPAVQKKAQKELDKNIGRARTPNMKEALSLPYLAIWKETLRMMPPLPLGGSISITITIIPCHNLSIWHS
jgi:cytochrome P450